MPEQEVTVSVDWLSTHLHDDNLVVVDGSWHLPTENRDPKAEYDAGHIPGAVFFDFEKHSNNQSELSHMMPGAAQFGREMGELGISDKNTIVIYDAAGLFSAARIWWMFRQFGASRTFVLDGGLPAWQKAGHPVEKDQPVKSAAIFDAKISGDLIVSLKAMREAVESDDGPLLLDARGAGRFLGREPEPRADVRGGHMPGAINLPFSTLLDADKKLLPPEHLKEKIAAVGFDPSKPTIATCGSGVTACVVLLALARLGHENVPLYDASWSEWGALSDTPVETE